MNVTAAFVATMGGSTRRCRSNCDDRSPKLAIAFGALLGVLVVAVLVVSCTLGGDWSMDRKNDVEAQESNVATPEGGEPGARKDSFETIELREVGVEGPP